MKTLLAGALLLTLPLASFGATSPEVGGPEITGFLGSILAFINDVLIPFILGIGFLFFVWGMFQYFIAGGANDEKKESGKSLMVYATLGFVLIIIFWGVVNLFADATGLNTGTAPASDTDFLDGIEIDTGAMGSIDPGSGTPPPVDLDGSGPM